MKNKLILFATLVSAFVMSHAEFNPDSAKHLSPRSIGHSLSSQGDELFGKIVLTFDDGPHPTNTHKILKILNTYSDALELVGQDRIKATFFINGKQVANYSYHQENKYAYELLSLKESRINIIEDIINDGHILANHSVSHTSLTATFLNTSPTILQNEIKLTHDAVESFMPNYYDCNEKWYFRAPYGGWRAQNATDGNAEKEVVDKYVGPIFWDIGGAITYYPYSEIPSDAADWECNSKGKSPEFCARGYLNRTFRKITTDGGSKKVQGGIVLMHDIQNITPELLNYALRVWTGINPYDPAGETYQKLEKFVDDYDFRKVPQMKIVSLNEVKSFDEHDQRFLSGQCSR